MIILRLSIYDPDDDEPAVICKDVVLHDVYSKPEKLEETVDWLLRNYVHENYSRNKN